MSKNTGGGRRIGATKRDYPIRLDAPRAAPAPLDGHPDDGHEHRFTCIRCGVDQPTLAAPPPLDVLTVEGLARALHTVTVEEPGLLSDVDMLNDPLEGDPMPAARALLAALRDEGETT